MRRRTSGFGAVCGFPWKSSVLVGRVVALPRKCPGKLSGSLLDQLLQLPDAAVFFIFRRSSMHTRSPAHGASCLQALAIPS